MSIWVLEKFGFRRRYVISGHQGDSVSIKDALHHKDIRILSTGKSQTNSANFIKPAKTCQ